MKSSSSRAVLAAGSPSPGGIWCDFGQVLQPGLSFCAALIAGAEREYGSLQASLGRVQRLVCGYGIYLRESLRGFKGGNHTILVQEEG